MLGHTVPVLMKVKSAMIGDNLESQLSGQKIQRWILKYFPRAASTVSFRNAALAVGVGIIGNTK
jgi:hypothetical protein